MAINPYIKPQKKSSGGGLLGGIATLAGAAGGALLAGPGGAAAGASLGASLGGTAGGLIEGAMTKGPSAPEASPTIGTDAMSRRMASIEDDTFTQLRSAASALPNLPPDQRTAAAEPIMKALYLNASGKQKA